MVKEEKKQEEESVVSELEMSTVENEKLDAFWEEELELLKTQPVKDWDEVISSVSSAVIRRLNLADTPQLRAHLKLTMETNEGIRSVLAKELGLKNDE